MAKMMWLGRFEEVAALFMSKFLCVGGPLWPVVSQNQPRAHGLKAERLGRKEYLSQYEVEGA